MRAHTRCSGFTLIESAISLGVLIVLLGSMFSIAIEYLRFAGNADSDASVVLEGNRTFERILAVLHKSGRLDDGTSYPRVTAGGAELEFRLPVDLDGNGHPYDEATGEVEWHPAVFTISADESGDAGIYAAGVKVHHLGRNIFDLAFETVVENNELFLNEIGMRFSSRKQTADGHYAEHKVAGSVHMRN